MNKIIVDSSRDIIGLMPCGCPLRFPITHNFGCPEYKSPEIDEAKIKQIMNFGGIGMTREDVYKLIDGERECQDARWGKDIKSPRDWLCIIQYYLSAGFYATYNNTTECLNSIRKIAALCVAAMEQHETAPRESYKEEE